MKIQKILASKKRGNTWIELLQHKKPLFAGPAIGAGANSGK
jgi:hypothetical protein